LFLGSDVIFAILENKEEIKKQLPHSMVFLKDNLNDLSRMDDALHLLQFLIVMTEGHF
jgi:hypothetical protein